MDNTVQWTTGRGFSCVQGTCQVELSGNQPLSDQDNLMRASLDK